MYKYLVMVFLMCAACGSNQYPDTAANQQRVAYAWALEAKARRISEDEQIKALIGSANYLLACYDNQPGEEPCIRVQIRK